MLHSSKIVRSDVLRAIQPSSSVNKIDMVQACNIYTQTTKESQIEQKNVYREGTKHNQNKEGIKLLTSKVNKMSNTKKNIKRKMLTSLLFV